MRKLFHLIFAFLLLFSCTSSDNDNNIDDPVSLLIGTWLFEQIPAPECSGNNCSDSYRREILIFRSDQTGNYIIDYDIHGDGIDTFFYDELITSWSATNNTITFTLLSNNETGVVTYEFITSDQLELTAIEDGQTEVAIWIRQD